MSEVQSESVDQTLGEPKNRCPHGIRGQGGGGARGLWAAEGPVANGALSSHHRRRIFPRAFQTRCSEFKYFNINLF